jgi:hypothetical protein
MRYTFLILDTYHPGTVYLREQEYEDLCLFLEAERVPRAEHFGKT